MYCSQDGLRRRMDKLKSSIEEANLAVDKEREKNVSLLHMIFPPNIAKRLWLGKCKFSSHRVFNFSWTNFILFSKNKTYSHNLRNFMVTQFLDVSECK